MNDKLSNLIAKFTSFLFDNNFQSNDDISDDYSTQKDLILLITRNIDNQRVLEKIITKANYNFIQANSLKIAQSFDFQHEYGKPDLIILDLDKKPTEFEMFSLKLSNDVPVIRFVDGKAAQSSDNNIAFQENGSSKSSIERSEADEVTKLFFSYDLIVTRPVSAAKLLMLIGECLNKNTSPIIQ